MSPNFFDKFFEHKIVMAPAGREKSSGGAVALHSETSSETPEDEKITFTDGLAKDHKTAANEPTVRVAKPAVEVVSSSVHFEVGSDAEGLAVGVEASVAVPTEAVVKPKRTKKSRPAPEAVKSDEGVKKLAEEIGAKPAESKEIKSPVLVLEKPAEAVGRAKTMADLGRLKGIEGVVVKPRGKRGSTKKLAESETKVVPVVTQPQKEAVSVVAKQEGKKFPFPQKRDVFQDVISGDRVVVEEIVRIKGEKPWIYYTETDVHGGEKVKKDLMSKMQTENFRVLVAGMEKTDPIKEEYPDFYAKYDELMKKLKNVFDQKCVILDALINDWEEYVKGEYAGEIDEEKTKEKEEMNADILSQKEKIKIVKKEWKGLDDRIVEQGRKRFLLFANILTIEKSFPDYIDIEQSELGSLEEQQGLGKIDIESVEREYQKILLKRKVKAIEERYDQSVARNDGTYEDVQVLDDSKKKIKKLFSSISDASSLEDVKGVLDEMTEIEKKMFAKEDRQKRDDEKRERRERELAGGLVRQGKKKGKKTEGEKGGVNKGGRRQVPTKRMFASSINDEGAGSQQRNSGMARQRQENGSFSSEKQEEAQELMGQVDETIQGKIQVAKDIFENPANTGKISDERRIRYIGYLKDLGRDAENSLADVNISGLQTILEKVKGIEFRIEPSRAPKKVTEAPVISASEKPKEKTFEELEKTLSEIRRDSCKEVVKKGLSPYVAEFEAGQAEFPTLTLKGVIGFYDFDKVVKSFVPAVTKLLPNKWNKAEQKFFALEFVKREIISQLK